MQVYQSIFLAIAVSIPIVTLIAIGRALLCVYRSKKAKQVRFALWSILGIVGLLGIFAVVVIAWFGYGVAHMEKDIRSDLILLASTALPTYAAAYGMWRLAAVFESRLSGDDN